MGYHTGFEGKFKITPTLTLPHYQWLVDFSEERHEESGFPGIWCDWTPTKSGKFLEWNESEKFYSYAKWLEYLVKHFFEPKGYKLNGEVEWDGEEKGDVGKIIVKDNVIEVKKGKIVYE